MAGRLLASFTVAASAAQAPVPAPESESAKPVPKLVHTEYYPVHGENAAALLASIKANQPFARHAATDWRVLWSFESLNQPGESVPRSFKVRVIVRFTLPNWVDSERADQALQAEWKRYLSALQLHESAHAGFGVSAGKEIWRLLHSRDWRAADPSKLKTQIDEECNRTLEEFRALEVAYDKQTRHGRTQGAWLHATP
jgi:predicted secreted Zn-dependent protease